jgi:AraC-like DNA-binding protein
VSPHNFPFSRVSGFGPLPRLFESEEGSPALRRLLAGEDLPLDAMAPTTPVPFSSMNEVFNRAARQSGDSLFPVRVAQAMRPEDYGPIVHFALVAPTLAEGIRRLCRLGPLQSNVSVFNLKNDGREVSWSLDYIAARGLRIDHHALHVLVPMINFLRRYAGPSGRPVALSLASPRDATQKALENALEVPVRAGSGDFSVVFPSEWLALPRPATRAPAFLSLAETIAHYRQEALPRSMTDTVAALLGPIVGNAEIDLDVIAGKLNISRRTLQQRLSAEGASFRDISLGVRINRAKEMILNGQAPIAEVALSVGYSDQPHFQRAFKVMTGLTPQEFRRQNRRASQIAAEAAE